MASYTNLRTFKQIAENSPFSEATLRWLRFNAASNGLDAALVKVGSRVYFDLPVFERWLEERRLGPVEEG